MGAGQSSGDAANGAAAAQVKTSYYDLLGVARQATEDEIKKAYRRKALELHPDRNYGNEEEATKIFAEVQSAYEILSDPQERAWYDSHETAILRGDDGADGETHSYENVEVTTADDLARTIRRFNSNVEFTDSPSGFYGFLREQFDHLAREEEAAAAWDNTIAPEYPPFGHKDDTHDDVVKSFYSAWINFSTVKNFAWKDKYRLSEAPDRRIRRLMEKENNNLRQEAIREFNEAVRTFILFVRKRDPRYQPNTQSEEERQQVLRDAAAAQRARARAANQAKLEGEIPAWTQARDEDELESSEEEDVEEEVVECVACNKIFKSERQYEAHERSKKHQKAIQALQRKMQKESKNLNLDESQDTIGDHDWELIDDEDAHFEHDEAISNVDIEEEEQPCNDPDTRELPDVTAVDHATTTSEQLDDQDATLDRQAARAHTSDDESTGDTAEYLTSALADSTLDDMGEQTTIPSRKLGKAAQKRAKRAAASTTTDGNDNNHKCAGCDAAFSSRTRLFQHIKDHNHAAPKSTTSDKRKKGKSKR